MRSPIIRRSSSICVSPGPPRMPMPPRLALEVGPAPHQPRRQVLQLRQLDLQLALVAARALREDLEDQLVRSTTRHVEVALEVALLRRRQRLVEDDDVGARCSRGQRLDLVGLAACRRTAPRRAPCAARRRARRRRRRPIRRAGRARRARRRNAARAEVDADQDRAAPARRRRSNTASQAVDAQRRRVRDAARQGWSRRLRSRRRKFTARPGTTVEIACL